MTRTIEEILGREAIAAVRRPIEKARGLPAVAYTSEEFFELEQQTYFPRTWMAVAFTCDIPDPGDAMPVTIAGVPLILVRNGDGAINAFHNACRHRATTLITEPCKAARQFQCPYHAWTYDLNGKLIATPYFDGTAGGDEAGRFDATAYGLVPARCAVWHHWIFINLDGNAESIEEHMAPLAEFMNNADFGAMKITKRVDWEYQANWKFAVDSWENYHHIWAHKGHFLKMSDDINAETKRPWSDSLQSGSVVTLRRRIGIAPPYPFKPSGLPDFPIPEGAERVTGPSIIFPNLEVMVVKDNLTSCINDPVAHNRTISRNAFFFVGDAATAPEWEAGRHVTLERWLGKSNSELGDDGLRNQDFRIFERQQVARNSPAADHIVFSPVWEENVHYFQNHLLDVMRA